MRREGNYIFKLMKALAMPRPAKLKPAPIERSYVTRDYVEQYERGTLESQLAILMAHVGLTGIDLAELGGNHPALVPANDRSRSVIGYAARRTAEMREADFEALKHDAEQEIGQEDAPLTPEQIAYDARVFLAGLPTSIPGSPSDNPLEEARSIETYMIARQLTAKEAAHELGLSRSHVLNLMRILTLPSSILDQIEAGRLSRGHGRAHRQTMGDDQPRQGFRIARLGDGV